MTTRALVLCGLLHACRSSEPATSVDGPPTRDATVLSDGIVGDATGPGDAMVVAPDATTIADGAVDAPTVHDATVDGGGVAACTPCIDNVEDVDVPREPSLNSVIGIKWTTKLPYIALRHRVIASRERAVVATFNTLLLIDQQGNVLKEVPSADLEPFWFPSADRDGNVYFAGHAIYSVNADFGVRWLKLLAAGEVVRGTLALSPDGVVIFSTESGRAIGLSSSDGAMMWNEQLASVERFINQGFLSYAVEVDWTRKRSILREARTGASISCSYTIADVGYLHVFPAFGGEIVHEPLPTTTWYNNRITLLDRCHRRLWTLPEGIGLEAALLAPEGRLVVSDIRNGLPDSWISVFDRDGQRLAGPTKAGRPLIAGSDGTIYAARCSQWTSDPASLVALSPELEELWSVDLGACTFGGALFDSGLLVVAWESRDGVHVTGIQTRSRGIARTSWPQAFGGDNGSTSWGSPPVTSGSPMKPPP